MSRNELTDQQWEQIAPHLPPKAPTGRPRKDDRLILNAVLWIIRTGAPWRDLPEEHYGPWETVYGAGGSGVNRGSGTPCWAPS